MFTKQQFDHYKDTLIVIKTIQMCNFIKYIRLIPKWRPPETIWGE